VKKIIILVVTLFIASGNFVNAGRSANEQERLEVIEFRKVFHFTGESFNSHFVLKICEKFDLKNFSQELEHYDMNNIESLAHISSELTRLDEEMCESLADMLNITEEKGRKWFASHWATDDAVGSGSRTGFAIFIVVGYMKGSPLEQDFSSIESWISELKCKIEKQISKLEQARQAVEPGDCYSI